MNEESLIQEDKRQHPQCHYSQSFSQSCNLNKNNEYICETLKRVTRLCPGEKPVDILSSSSSSTDPMENKKITIPTIPSPFDNHNIFGSIFNNNRYYNF
jgi:hypothetical protein